jgi:hypothetical protein
MKLFPAVRLSDLRAQRERDRQKFHQSADNFQNIVHEKTRPFTFFLNHPGVLVGSIASLFALYEVGTSVLSPIPLKAVNGTARKTMGLMSRLTRLGLGVAMKTATPVISSLVQKVWTYANKKRQQPGDNTPS